MSGGVITRNRTTNAITMGPDDRITRQLGSIYCINSGSIVVPEFLEGKPWYLAQDPADGLVLSSLPPSVKITGSTLSWTAQVSLPQRPSRGITVIYGVC